MLARDVWGKWTHHSSMVARDGLARSFAGSIGLALQNVHGTPFPQERHEADALGELWFNFFCCLSFWCIIAIVLFVWPRLA